MTSSIIFHSDSELTYSFYSSFPVLWLARLFPFLCSHWLSGITSSVSAGPSKAGENMEPIYATGMAAKLRSQWDRDAGLGQNHNAVKFLGQDYDSLRAQCQQTRTLFEDHLFPASASSLGFNELGPRSSKTHGVRWMRPTVSWPQGSWGSDGFVSNLFSKYYLFYTPSLLDVPLVLFRLPHFIGIVHQKMKMYSPSGYPRCRWDCFFIRTDLETFSITSLAQQWMLCSEWVPSEWESKQLIKTSQ